MMLKSKNNPLLLIVVTALTLSISGCGKKEANAAEAQKPTGSPQTEPQAISAQPIVVPDTPSDNRRMTAIFMVNHANKSFDDKLATLEDFVTGPVTEKGYSVISREVTTDATSGFLKQNSATSLDDALDKSSSAARLAQMLNANYLMLVSISSFGSKENKTSIGGSEVSQTVYTLRATYKLTGSQGATLASAPVSVTDSTMSTTGSEAIDSDVLNRLLEKAAVEIAGKIPAPPTVIVNKNLAEFSIVCSITDAGGQALSLPDIRFTEDRTVVIEKTPVPVMANATVELDGAAVGSTPDAFRALPGLHKIKLTHGQCEPWEKTIVISPGQRLKVVLQMTDSAYQRWKDQTAFLQTLENGRKLTDAEVERVKGLAQMLKQSGTKVDIKVDTKEGMKVYKSIY
jgi:hypothetical protein